MRVLLVGGGGREHALGWKLAQSPGLTELVSVPGNPGLAGLGRVVDGADITDTEQVAAVAASMDADLVVVGPEAPLAAGLVDVLESAGVAAFGPTAAGARLEASKRFAKEVMARAGVPTADARAFTDAAEAADHLASAEPPYVVKADGLAAGKGVLVTEDLLAAQGWARVCLEGLFGEAGTTVVIEQHLRGREVSVFALCDGTRAVTLQPARDYKRLADGDVGPNTGGMGCFAPVEDLPEDLVEWTGREVIDPVLASLADEGIRYRGFLYAGMMLTEEGPMVLEFNCRMGDPEAQVVLPLLRDDLLTLLSRPLPDRPLTWDDGAAVDVVIASDGYPERPVTGGRIDGVEGLDGADDVIVFHAGTGRDEAGIYTAGGRVLNVVGLGDTVARARERAYAAVEEIRFPGMQYRKDIAAT